MNRFYLFFFSIFFACVIYGQEQIELTPMHQALLAGDLSQIQVLLKDQSLLEEKNIFGLTPLHGAVYLGQQEVVSYLLACGAQINSLDIQQMSVIESAVLYATPSILGLLVEGCENSLVHRALLLAFKYNKTDMIAILLPHVHRLELDPQCMLQCALYAKDEALLSEAIEAGAIITPYLLNQISNAFGAPWYEKAAKDALNEEEARAWMIWTMLEKEQLEDHERAILQEAFLQELSYIDQGGYVFSHACSYELGKARQAYTLLYNALYPQDAFPDYYVCPRFWSLSDKKDNARCSSQYAYERLKTRIDDNSDYFFCQASALHGISNYIGESPAAFYMQKAGARTFSFSLYEVLSSLVPVYLLEKYTEELKELDQLYAQTKPVGQGLLYIFAVTKTFAKDYMRYRQVYSGNVDLLGCSYEYVCSGQYRQIEHVVPVYFMMQSTLIREHMIDMKVFGYPTESLMYNEYQSRLRACLDSIKSDVKRVAV